MIYISKNVKETNTIASEFALKLKPRETVLLFGELGAGKTTFVQAIAKALGIKDRILSPTFILHRSYQVQKLDIKYLNHIDLYRIEDPQEIQMLGIAEFLEEPRSITLIEWAQRLKKFKLKNGYKIYFKYLEDDKREITIIKQGEI